jgi:hypothetical protein
MLKLQAIGEKRILDQYYILSIINFKNNEKEGNARLLFRIIIPVSYIKLPIYMGF